MTPHQCLDASLHDFHRDFPRRIVRELGWCEDEVRKLGKSSRAARRLRIYNGSGVLHVYGGLDYFMELIRTKDHCYTLLI